MNTSMDDDPSFTVVLTLDDMYLLSELLRSRIDDLRVFNNADGHITQAKTLLKIIGEAKTA